MAGLLAHVHEHQPRVQGHGQVGGIIQGAVGRAEEIGENQQGQRHGRQQEACGHCPCKVSKASAKKDVDGLRRQ
ncbi:hypothetical protein GCM10027048_21300 [Hymenobacter coalescens]